MICPQNMPKHGYVIYDETVAEAAKHRLEMTIAQLKEAGIEATGELMDPNPYTAVMDALGDRDYDEIIISTHPETRSGWLRQDLIHRVATATRRPVEHVVVDLEAERRATSARTLVVANQTVGGEPLLEKLKELAAERPAPLHRDLPAGRGRRGAPSGWPTRSSCSRTRGSRRSARSRTPTRTRPSRPRSSSTTRTRS